MDTLGSGKVERIIPIPTPQHGKPFIEEWPTAVSNDSRYFALTTIEETFRLVDLANGFSVHTFGEHHGWIGGVTVLARSGLIATAGGNDQAVRFWSIETGEMEREWKDVGQMSAIAASPSERYIVVSVRPGIVKVFGVRDGELAAEFRLDAPVTVLDIHLTEPLIAVGDETGRMHILHVENCSNWVAPVRLAPQK